VRRLTHLTLTVIVVAGACRRPPDRPVVADTADRRVPGPSSDSGPTAARVDLPSADSGRDTAEARRDQFISGGPRAWSGRTRARIRAAFGPPERIEAHPDATEGSGPQDSLVTFQYARAAFAFYTGGGAHEDQLLQATIWDARFLKRSPIQLGSTVAEVRSFFGDSAQGSTALMRYTTGGGIPDDLELWFEQDRLVKLRWTYGFD
jgi:hypothetical protein